MSKVLITGASGFIGTNLTQSYLDRGFEVLNIDIAEPRIQAHNSFWRKVDVRDEASFTAAAREFKPDFLFHLAARTDIDGTTIQEYDSNTDGTRNAVKAAKAAGSVSRAVFFSSQLVLRVGYTPKNDEDVNPPNPYGDSKAVGEKIVRAESDGAFPWVIVRPTTIWGPWFGVKYQGLYRQIRRGRYMHPKGVKIKKVWGYVGNSVFSLSKLAEADAALVDGKTLYLADNKPTDLHDYAEIIRNCWGAPPIREVPVTVLKSVAIFGDALKMVGKSFPLTSYRLNNMLSQMDVSIDPLKQACGPQPFSLQQSAEQTVEWLRANEGFDRD
ncbi:MAG: NAD(P)-dependent oxidoreductase [Chthonomonadales bacterium]